MTQSFMLAHLSDVHLGPVAGFSPRHWGLKRGFGYLNWIAKRRSVHLPDVFARLVEDLIAQAPDHVAVTGDLVNIGLPAEYEAALRWLDRLGPPGRVTVVPGNHDIYVRLAKDPGAARWAAYMRPCAWGAEEVRELGDSGGRNGSIAPCGFPFLRRAGPLALIGLNSAVPTPLFVAAGRLGAGQLAGLAAALDRARAAGLIRAVLIHHPPLPGQAPPRRALEDAAELEGVLAVHGAELVLHGHNHRDTLVWHRTPAGSILVAGIASASAGRRLGCEPLARYNLFRFTRHAGEELTIELQARGLREPDGPVVDLGRRLVMPDFGR